MSTHPFFQVGRTGASQITLVLADRADSACQVSGTPMYQSSPIPVARLARLCESLVRHGGHSRADDTSTCAPC